jgi:uncharacterized RDD family membrane protein YckC
MKYVGFWGRFGAYWIDVLVQLPLTGLAFFVAARWKYYFAAMVLPTFLVELAYHVYLVKRFGGTPGKLMLGQRIVTLRGAPVGYRAAFLRYVVLMLLALGTSTAGALGALRIPDAEYAALTTWIALSQRIIDSTPWWYQPTNVALQVWVWSEFIVLLTNKKRRALHDFMAGTVVIRRDSV